MLRVSSWMCCLAAAVALSLIGSGVASAEEDMTRESPLQRFEACEILILEDNEYLQYVENAQREHLTERKEKGAPPQRLDELKARYAGANAILKVHILEKSEMCRIHYAEAKRQAKKRMEGCRARLARRKEALAAKVEEQHAHLVELKEEGKSKEKIEEVKAHYAETQEEIEAKIAAKVEACSAISEEGAS